MAQFADVAFPTAIRQLFTYEISASQQKEELIGKRVWVPFRNYFAIGMVVKVHDQKPEFDTKEIKKILDETPILNQEMLELTEWIHKFYFSSWGEVIQAALPVGLNYISRKFLRVSEDLSEFKLNEKEKSIIEEVQEKEKYDYTETQKRWKGTSNLKVLNQLIKKDILQIWEEPDLKQKIKYELLWEWLSEEKREEVLAFLKDQEKKPKWILALERLTEISLPIRQSSLKKEKLLDTPKLKRIEKEGWIKSSKVEAITEYTTLSHQPDSIKELNLDQENAFKSIEKYINSEKFKNFLLYGITGSGKTEVYIHALKSVLAKGKTGIVLVPEIALTPQTVSRFYQIFGDEIAVLHSRLNNNERLKAWKDLKEGKKKIAIGPRSAIFAPVQNLGIIILDEEHDSSYKQFDPSPRYHARETAIMRANANNAVVIMGSATPSMQALEMCTRKKATILELENRHADAVLPQVKVLDLKQYRNAMKGELAIPLFMSMNEALEKKEQIILLLNRRGFGNYLQCKSCGHIPKSPECSVSLTYHKRKNILMCHYSGYSRRADTHCEKCGSKELEIKGSGTQNIEEQLEEHFPKAKILRFDRDSTSTKNGHEKILNAFGKGDADILIGTQLVAKGLDFPNVTVVGVIDADTELAFPSFQAEERMFQLLSQVSGRSGRGSKPGIVYIQTRNPENQAIQFAAQHNHKNFSKTELGFRKALNYPPYSRLIRFIFKDEDEQKTQNAAFFFSNVVEKVAPSINQLGPSPAAIAWMNKKFVWEHQLKISTDKGENYIELLVSKLLSVYEEHRISELNSVRININVDAID